MIAWAEQKKAVTTSLSVLKEHACKRVHCGERCVKPAAKCTRNSHFNCPVIPINAHSVVAWEATAAMTNEYRQCFDSLPGQQGLL